MSDSNSQHRLFQLISPSLPIGSFTYSQGLEWAYEIGWINNAEQMEAWLEDLMQTALARLEVPLLLRLMKAWHEQDRESIIYWNQYLMASRESAELKQEEKNRGRALATLLATLAPCEASLNPFIAANQTSAFAYACVQWSIKPEQACSGFIWSWLENLVLTAVKIIPLGQTQGQSSLFNLSQHITKTYESALKHDDADIGYSNFALAIASAQHETQYTRLYRS